MRLKEHDCSKLVPSRGYNTLASRSYSTGHGESYVHEPRLMFLRFSSNGNLYILPIQDRAQRCGYALKADFTVRNWGKAQKEVVSCVASSSKLYSFYIYHYELK